METFKRDCSELFYKIVIWSNKKKIASLNESFLKSFLPEGVLYD